MVQITKEENNYVFEVKGLHKLWAFKSQLVIPKEHILSVKMAEEEFKSFAFRLWGTSLPPFLYAGVYYNKKSGMMFWDVAKKHNCIVIELADENFKKLIIEVEDTLEAMSILQK